MENINNLDSPNRYLQGSIWKWKNNAEQKAGVQSNDRPVFVISNNNFNSFSPVVNCVTITSQLKESPVHVPIHIIADSHIQCEQLHTVNKTELVDFIGMVSNSTLSSVKAKLRIQFDMGIDRNAEMFSSIKRSIDDLNTNPEIMNSINENLEMLNAKADKGFGVPDIENDFLGLVLNLENNIKKIVAEVEKLKSDKAQEIPQEAIEIIQTGTSDAPLDNIKEKKPRGKRKNYTYEDKLFIADKNNSIQDLMERYGYDKPTAYKMRDYFKKRVGKDLEKNNTPEPNDDSGASKDENPGDTPEKTKKVYRRYTDEDKKYILDKNNTIEEIMEKYDYKKKQDVFWIRSKFKKAMKNE